MSRLRLFAAGLIVLIGVSCAGLASPPSPESATTVQLAASPTAVAPTTGRLFPQLFTGTAGPLLAGVPPCFADRYACTVYDFSLVHQGAIEVAITWEGSPRALMVQLYWAGEGLAHEDVAPINGPSRIHFRRPLMEAADYSLRVVNLEPARAIPFTLALTR